MQCWSLTCRDSALRAAARQVTLKEQRSSTFVDVRMAPAQPGQPVGSNGVYALTQRGTLLLMRSTGRTIDRQVHLQVRVQAGLWCLARASCVLPWL
jgi:hypothetical protein